MNINGISGAGIQPNAAAMGAGEQTDPVSRDLKNQIEKLRNDLKEISADQNMPTEAKMKKRQEIQKQISELEIQLRQHQMEVKRQERQKKQEESSFDELAGTKPQEEQPGNTQNTGMSTGSMEAMISADTAVKQANVNGSTAKKMEGRANVLKVEMQLDGGRGGSSNIDLKEAELAKVSEAAEKATASQMDSLARAGKTLQAASRADAANDGNEKADQTDNGSGQTDRTGDNSGKADQADGGKIGGNADRNEDGLTDAWENDEEENGFVYRPVDVRL